jgi:hypothetical protein
MVRFKPTVDQRAIANAFSQNAQLLGRPATQRELLDATATRFQEPRLGQLIAHVAARQAEFGRAVVDEYREGRFSAATAIVRPLLEMAAWIAWPFSVPQESEQKKRLVQLLLQSYREIQAAGVKLPRDVLTLLAATTGRAARKAPSFRQMLKDLDALERRTEGGQEYWVSHYANFDWASNHVHPSLYGRFLGRDSDAANDRVGVNALVYGHQYLAITGVTCAIAGSLDHLKSRIEQRYGSVADIQKRELDRIWHPVRGRSRRR